MKQNQSERKASPVQIALEGRVLILACSATHRYCFIFQLPHHERAKTRLLIIIVSPLFSLGFQAHIKISIYIELTLNLHLISPVYML